MYKSGRRAGSASSAFTVDKVTALRKVRVCWRFICLPEFGLKTLRRDRLAVQKKAVSLRDGLQKYDRCKEKRLSSPARPATESSVETPAGTNRPQRSPRPRPGLVSRGGPRLLRPQSFESRKVVHPQCANASVIGLLVPPLPP